MLCVAERCGSWVCGSGPLAEIPGVSSSGARRGLWPLIFSGCCYRKYEWHLRETKHRIKVNAFDFLQIIRNPCGPVIIYTWLGHSNKSETVTESAAPCAQ